MRVSLLSAVAFAAATLAASPVPAQTSPPEGRLLRFPDLHKDFVVFVYGGDVWRAPAVPFDNRAAAPAHPPRGLHPVAGVWRLFQSDATGVDELAPIPAVASLMGCVAFPWAMPDLADAVLEQAARFVAESRFAHLRFTLDPSFWPMVVP